MSNDALVLLAASPILLVPVVMVIDLVVDVVRNVIDEFLN